MLFSCHALFIGALSRSLGCFSFASARRPSATAHAHVESTIIPSSQTIAELQLIVANNTKVKARFKI